MTPAQIRKIADRIEPDCNRGRSIGANEALILTVLQSLDALSVADVALRLEKAEILVRSIDDGSIYLALYRMSQRGLVSVVKRSVISADGRRREIGFYAITEAGQKAVSQFEADSRAVIRLQEIRA
jgi:DNA-binding PadR family transcriptional regulator